MNTPGVDRSAAAARLPRPPVRTCVGCRTRAHQRDLLRVALVDGRVVPDPKHEHSGRGAYVHPSGQCVRVAIARKAFGRAFRTGGPLDLRDLVAFCSPMTEPNVGSVGMTTR
jgi:predicted RNA-binding protein YlxR (DUF448 family)